MTTSDAKDPEPSFRRSGIYEPPERQRQRRYPIPERWNQRLEPLGQEGGLEHRYNFFGIEQYFAEGKQTTPAGKHQVRMGFSYDGCGLAKGEVSCCMWTAR